MHISRLLTIGFALTLVPLFSASSQSVTNTVSGIQQFEDEKGRSPVLTVTAENLGERVQIRADVLQRHEDLKQFPIQVDFYINRRLFSQQLRAPELTGPLGVDVGPDIASLPFNYAVVAKVLTPNGRPFTSMLSGAVFSNDFTALLDCTLSLQGEGDAAEFVANNVGTVQTGNDSFQLTFEAEAIQDDSVLDVSVAVTASETSASGTLTFSQQGNALTSRSEQISGTIEQTNTGRLELLDAASSDGAIALRCS